MQKHATNVERFNPVCEQMGAGLRRTRPSAELSCLLWLWMCDTPVILHRC